MDKGGRKGMNAMASNRMRIAAAMASLALGASATGVSLTTVGGDEITGNTLVVTGVAVEETDPTVPAWAKAAEPPSADVHAEEITNIAKAVTGEATNALALAVAEAGYVATNEYGAISLPTILGDTTFFGDDVTVLNNLVVGAGPYQGSLVVNGTNVMERMDEVASSSGAGAALTNATGFVDIPVRGIYFSRYPDASPENISIESTDLDYLSIKVLDTEVAQFGGFNEGLIPDWEFASYPKMVMRYMDTTNILAASLSAATNYVDAATNALAHGIAAQSALSAPVLYLADDGRIFNRIRDDLYLCQDGSYLDYDYPYYDTEIWRYVLGDGSYYVFCYDALGRPATNPAPPSVIKWVDSGSLEVSATLKSVLSAFPLYAPAADLVATSNAIPAEIGLAISTNNAAFVAAVTNCPVVLTSGGGVDYVDFGQYGTLGALLAALAAAVVALRKAKMDKYPFAAASVESDTLTLQDAVIQTWTPSAGASVAIAAPTGTSATARDLELVIDCSSLAEGDEPTVTWPAAFHPRTDAGTDFACAAGVRNVYYISEYAPGEFAVGGWQETAGGNA